MFPILADYSECRAVPGNGKTASYAALRHYYNKKYNSYVISKDYIEACNMLQKAPRVMSYAQFQDYLEENNINPEFNINEADFTKLCKLTTLYV